jgi:coatomer protein complex subunit alpha (xenin)
MARFHNALFLGNIEERVAVLREAGQLRLAYVCARTHGLEELAATIATELGDKVPTIDLPKARLLIPPTPLLKENNWPQLAQEGSTLQFVDAPDEPEEKVAGPREEYGSDDEVDPTVDWPAEGESKGAGKKKGDSKQQLGGGEEAPSSIFDLDLGDLGGDDTSAGATGGAGESKDGDYFVMPLNGKASVAKWSNSILAADLVASGQFDMAMHVLNKQLGIANFGPLKSRFLSIHAGAHCLLPQLPGSEAWLSSLLRTPNGDEKGDGLPQLPYQLQHCVDKLKEGYKAATDGDFAGSLAHFQYILHSIPLLVVEKPAQVPEVQELLGICREYVTAMRLELARKDADATRQAALSAYFTHCKLQSIHLILFLKLAIKCSYTIKNFKTTGGLCRRILELSMSSTNPNIQKIVNPKQITQLLQVCEKTNTDAVAIDYDDSSPLVLDCESFTPLLKSRPQGNSSYSSSHPPLCRVCACHSFVSVTV